MNFFLTLFSTKDSYTNSEINELFDGVDLIYKLLADEKKSQIEFSVFRAIKLSKNILVKCRTKEP